MQTPKFYFSYGSNLSSRRMQSRIAGARPLCTARLHGHQLAFHKCSARDHSAKCDAWHTGRAADVVMGVVYEVHPADRPVLDRIEGAGFGYEVAVKTLYLDSGESLDAFLYCATDIDAQLRPYEWYREHVLVGLREHAFPEEYVRMVEQVEAMPDPDRQRHTRELAIYV